MDVEKPQIGDASTQHVDDAAFSTPPDMDEVESQPMSRQSMLAFAVKMDLSIQLSVPALTNL